MNFFHTFVLLSTAVLYVVAQHLPLLQQQQLQKYTQFDGCKCQPNNNTIWEHDLVLLNTTTNGKLYLAGGTDNPLYIVHLYGTPYDMGVAQGVLLKQQILEMYSEFWTYMEEQVDASNPLFKYIPEFLRKIIEDSGVEAALEYEALITRDFVSQSFSEEIQGLADALGLSHSFVLRVAMFPELIKAACSIMGAWGKATTDGGLLHLRALDWGTENPFRRFAVVHVYHPNAGNGHAFAQLGWTGLIGALTGYSPYVGAGEKVWIHYNGTDARAGIPWTFVFRDMLQFDKSVEESISRLHNAHRTCSVFLGIGDHKGNFTVVEYSLDYVINFTDSSPFPGYAPTPAQHPLFTNVVYVDKHTQPSSDPCMGNVIKAYYGKIDVQSIITLASVLQTGDMHAAIMDYKNSLMYISLATQIVPFPAPNPDPTQPAYNRQFIKLDISKAFAESL